MNNFPKQPDFTRGFTLIELLVVVSMVAMIGLGIYRVFNSGIKLWQWNAANAAKVDVAIFFDGAAQDLKKCFKFRESFFEGHANKLSFLAHDSDYLISSKGDLIDFPSMGKASIVTVEYMFIPQRKEIQRRIYSFGAKKLLRATSALSQVEKAHFIFYTFDKKQKKFLRSYFLTGVFPDAVEFIVEVRGASDAVEVFRRTLDTVVLGPKE